jgi:hypothetical protein
VGLVGLGTRYIFPVPCGGYSSGGNMLGCTDSVTGSWQFGYDLNWLVSAAVSPATNEGADFCWAYDSIDPGAVNYASPLALLQEFTPERVYCIEFVGRQ